MKDENYIVIQGWMINKLKLSGNELAVYAIIYGFSQDDSSKFRGSGQYIADSVGISRRAVSIILNNLTQKGFIKKYEYKEKGVKRCDYSAVNYNFTEIVEDDNKRGMEEITIPMEENSIGVWKNLPRGIENFSMGGMEKTANHIANKDKIDIKLDNKDPGDSDESPISKKQAHELSNLLLTTHRKEIPDFLSGKDKDVIPRWADDIEKLIRIDQKSPETIREVILWAKSDNFWFSNIMSGKKLREKYETLYGQMKTRVKSTGPPPHKITRDNISDDKVDQYFSKE